MDSIAAAVAFAPTIVTTKVTHATTKVSLVQTKAASIVMKVTLMTTKVTSGRIRGTSRLILCGLLDVGGEELD